MTRAVPPRTSSFAELQGDLGDALAANTAGSTVPHVVIALPSYSVSETLMAHYGPRVSALEHRYLLSTLMTHRLPHVELVYLSSLAPTREVIDLYRRLGPRPDRYTDHAHLVALEERTPRSMADKLLDRPDVLEALRRRIGGRPAVIEPWNVTAAEVAVAEALQLPVNGTDPALWPIGFKSAGRRLLRDAGVPVPFGYEDVRLIDDVLVAIQAITGHRPQTRAVVVKHDDSGAGDGNTVIDLRTHPGDPTSGLADSTTLRDRIERLPSWYLADLAGGGVVEELVVGEAFSSPSVQVDLLPDGEVRVLATHEQVLGGDSRQVFLGCRFPADPAYAADLARFGYEAGRSLAHAGARGRASIDFAAAGDGSGSWRLYALEINLRKGGTTHPYAALRNLVPGHYDSMAGAWIRESDGSSRVYACTDNLVDTEWLGLPAERVIAGLSDAGLLFDHRTGSGVVPHMLSGLDIDGRLGATAFATEHPLAEEMLEQVRRVVDQAAGSRHPAGSSG